MTSRWPDLATWRGPTPNVGGPMREQRGLVIHIAQGGFEGTISWQKNPAAQVSSHFVVGLDGAIAQVVDLDVTAWTQIAGNGHWLSVENAGFVPHALTPAQVEANAQLLARCHREFGVPLQIATSPSGRGLGHHSMGAENGVNWGHSDCPGPHIIAQKPAILARAVEIINGGNTVTAPTPAQNEHAVWHTAGSTGNKDADGKPISAGTAVGATYDRLIRVEQAIAALPDAIAQAVVKALPPVGGVTTSGDFTVTGTLHEEPAAG